MTSQTNLQARLDELMKEREGALKAAGWEAVTSKANEILYRREDLAQRWEASADQLAKILDMLDSKDSEVVSAAKTLARGDTSDAEKREAVRELLSRIKHLDSALRKNRDELEMHRAREARVYTLGKELTKGIHKIRAEILGVEYHDPDEDPSSWEADSGRPGSSRSRTRARRVESEPALPNLSLES
ncbi:hypothetical protein LIA77_02218 [Sarocladium implicatum]|nr:hypothetical protein LIA77_02218 [Sarocladium implicatum]